MKNIFKSESDQTSNQSSDEDATAKVNKKILELVTKSRNKPIANMTLAEVFSSFSKYNESEKRYK